MALCCGLSYIVILHDDSFFCVCRVSVVCLTKAIDLGGSPGLYLDRAGAYQKLNDIPAFKKDIKEFLAQADPHHRSIPRGNFFLAYVEVSVQCCIGVLNPWQFGVSRKLPHACCETGKEMNVSNFPGYLL